MNKKRKSPPRSASGNGLAKITGGQSQPQYSTKNWMPIWIGDYLADTRRLTTEQHGAYLLLIFDYWRQGPLPDDDVALAQIVGLPESRWKKNRSTIATFFRVDAGQWRHKRIDREIEQAREHKAKMAARAKKAAEARWGKADG